MAGTKFLNAQPEWGLCQRQLNPFFGTEMSAFRSFHLKPDWQKTAPFLTVR